MDDNNEKKLSDFQFEGAKYRTQLTESFVNRTKWVPENPYMIKAVIPGTIVKINVKVGQKVNKGRLIFILEAMKMKNKILSGISGEVVKIFVEEGQKVSKNELIMEFKNSEQGKRKTLQRVRRSKS